MRQRGDRDGPAPEQVARPARPAPRLDGVRELVQRRRRVAQLRLRPLRVDRVAPFKQSEGLVLVAQFQDDLRVLA